MLVRSIGVIATALILSPALARAEGCLEKTKATKAYAELESRVEAAWKKAKEKDADASILYFVVPGEKGNDEPRILPYSFPPGEHHQIDAELAKSLSGYPGVRVFNKTASSSLYFMPYQDSEIRGIHANYEFRQARITSRFATTGCSWLNLKGRETVTILGGTIAVTADKVADVQRDSYNKIMTDGQLKLYTESVDILETKLGKIRGVNRSPSTLERPTIYAEKVNSQIEKKLVDKPATVPINVDLQGNPIPQKVESPKKTGGAK